jgi:hypothetical protein|tara:strand:+ start:145 stop:378 length:234 start_codon:yes stop_codon:yes gene_type:complete
MSKAKELLKNMNTTEGISLGDIMKAASKLTDVVEESKNMKDAAENVLNVIANSLLDLDDVQETEFWTEFKKQVKTIK